jgi:hypothetical protein
VDHPETVDRRFFLLEEGKNIESRLHRQSLNENSHWMARVVGGPTLLGTGFFGDIYRSLYAGFDDYFRNLVPSSKRDCQPAELLDKKVRLIQ